MQRFLKFSNPHLVRTLSSTHRAQLRRFATMNAAETDGPATDVANNSSGITPTSLQQTLTQKLEAQHVHVEDISGGCGQSFEARIVSPLFEKKNTLARHRLVNAAVKTEIAAIHAWTPKCFTPEEWRRKMAVAGEEGLS